MIALSSDIHVCSIPCLEIQSLALQPILIKHIVIFQIQVDFDQRVVRPPDVVPPDELGIGDEEDTATNATRLLPRPPVKDYHKFLENDRKVLRFIARLVAAQGCRLINHHDPERR